MHGNIHDTGSHMKHSNTPRKMRKWSIEKLACSAIKNTILTFLSDSVCMCVFSGECVFVIDIDTEQERISNFCRSLLPYWLRVGLSEKQNKNKHLLQCMDKFPIESLCKRTKYLMYEVKPNSIIRSHIYTSGGSQNVPQIRNAWRKWNSMHMLTEMSMCTLNFFW